jgi:hypothetical protein
MTATWSWYMAFLVCCWIWFASIFLRIFFIHVHQIYMTSSLSLSLYIYIYIFMYVFMYVCIYVYLPHSLLPFLPLFSFFLCLD